MWINFSALAGLPTPREPLYSDLEEYAGGARNFCFFYGLPGSGRGLLLDQLARFAGLDLARVRFTTPRVNDLLASLAAALGEKVPATLDGVIAELNQRKNFALVLEGFHGQNAFEALTLFLSFQTHLRGGGRLWVVGDRRLGGLEGRLAYYCVPRKLGSPLFELVSVPYPEARFHSFGVLDDALFEKCWAQYTAGLPADLVDQLLTLVFGRIPLPVTAIHLENEAEMAGLTELLDRGFVLEQGGFLFPHPFLKSPGLSLHLARCPQNEKIFHRLLHPPALLQPLLPGGDLARFWREVPAQPRDRILAEAPYLRFLLGLEIRAGRLGASRLRLLEAVSVTVSDTLAALRLLTRRRKRCPAEARGLLEFHRGLLFTRLGRPDLARTCFREASKSRGLAPRVRAAVLRHRLDHFAHSGRSRRALDLLKSRSGGSSPESLALRGHCFFLQQRFRQSGEYFKRVVTLAEAAGEYPLAILALDALCRQKLAEGDLTGFKHFSHRGRRLNAQAPGYPYAGLFDLTQARFHLLKSELAPPAGRDRQLAHAATCLDCAGGQLLFRRGWFRRDRLHELGHLALARGEPFVAARRFRTAARSARREKDWASHRRNRLAWLGVKIRFPSPGGPAEKWWPALEKLGLELESRDDLELQLETVVLQAEFYFRRKYPARALSILESRFPRFENVSLSRAKLAYLQLALASATAVGRDADRWSHRLRAGLENLPHSFPLLVRRPPDPVEKVAVAGETQYFSVARFEQLRAAYPNLTLIDLRAKKIALGNREISFQRNFKLGEYLRFFCDRPGRHSHRQIFEEVEGEEYLPDEDGNKLRQYMKRLRRLFDQLDSGLGDRALRATGEAAYEFRAECFLVRHG